MHLTFAFFSFIDKAINHLLIENNNWNKSIKYDKLYLHDKNHKKKPRETKIFVYM